MVILAVILVALILHKAHLKLSDAQESSPQNGRVTDTDIVTTYSNEAYGLAPDMSSGRLLQAPHTSNTEHNKAENGLKIAMLEPARVVSDNVGDSTERSDTSDNPTGGWPKRDIGTNVEGIQDLEDDDPDYEKLVSPDRLFGEYVQPDHKFVTTPNSIKVQLTFKFVVYSELKGYPCSGRMATSRSLPNITDHCREGDKHVLNKQKNWQKAD